MAEGADDDQERSEDPTQKRLDDAVKKGDVAKSQEVNTWFLLAGGTFALYSFGGFTADRLARAFTQIFSQAHAFGTDGRAIIGLIGHLMLETFIAIGPVIFIAVIAALAGNMIQHRFVWTSESMKPKASRISLAQGAKRLFSKQALVQFAKGLAKIALVSSVIVAVIWPQMEHITQLIAAEHTEILPVANWLSLKLLMAVTAVTAVIAGLDWLWMQHTWYER